MAKTLEELKRENAAAESADTEAPEVEEEITEDVAETGTEDQAETEEAETSEEETDSEDLEVEPWMQVDEQTSNDSADQLIPIAKHRDVRQALKGTIREQNTEIEALKAEIEALKQTQKPVEASADIGPLPVLEDFDLDRAKYDAAVKDWFARMNAANLQKLTQETQRVQQQQQVTQRLHDSVNQHYQRAEQLIEKAKISPEVYQAADTNVRQMIENIRPGHGEQITDQLISTLGEGSEKVMLYVGRNPAKLSQLQSALVNDQTGLQAMAFLSRLSAEVSAPRQKQSTAPKPAAKVRGDQKTRDPHQALKKKYDAAKTVQERINIRMDAKRAGANVSNW